MSLRISSTDSLILYFFIFFTTFSVLFMFVSSFCTFSACMCARNACFIYLFYFCLGEHPAAMQRGCANNNINLSILLYILSLSLLIQYLNRILSTFVVLHVISPHRNQPNINDDTSEIHLDSGHIHALMDSTKSPTLNLR